MKRIKDTLQIYCAAASMIGAGSSLKAQEAVWTAASGLLPTGSTPPWLYYQESSASVSLEAGVLRINTANHSARATYFQETDHLDIPDNLVIESRVRFISGSSSQPAHAPAGIYFYTQQGVANRLWIGRDEIFVNASSASQKGPAANVDTDDAFHTYRIEVHGRTNGSSFDVFYDGILTITGTLFLDDEDQEPEIAWGDISYSASGESLWESFRHTGSAPSLAIFCAAEICWASRTNKFYQVQWASSLPATNWTNLGPPVEGTGADVCIFDSTREQTRRFYRVETLLDPPR